MQLCENSCRTEAKFILRNEEEGIQSIDAEYCCSFEEDGDCLLSKIIGFAP